MRNKFLRILFSTTSLFAGCILSISPAQATVVDDFSVGEISFSTQNENPTEYVFDEVPLFNQIDYGKDDYGGHGTVRTHGCGITSVAMVASYLQDHLYSPADLAKQFGRYNTPVGSSWSLFQNSADELGLGDVIQTHDWEEARQALEDGHVVISLERKNAFTSSGHYIVLTGLTEDGKVMVNDPNGCNWDKFILKDGFKNGFDSKMITNGGGPWWIYPLKSEIQQENQE